MLALLVLLPITTDITFIRHGETVANATGRYSTQTLNTFSEKGKRGVAALTKRLSEGPRYDRILVSPAERALRTIAPYLKASHQKATVWPLLYECCTGRKQPRSKKPLKFGEKIKLPADIAAYFVIEPSQDRFPSAPSYAMGLVQVDASVREFKAKYNIGNVLLVGHSGHGGQFIHALTGKWKKIENTTEIHFRVQ